MYLCLIAYFFDIGHPCYGQMTPVKSRYLLTSITYDITGSGLELIEVTWFVCLFEVDHWPGTGFLLDSRLKLLLTKSTYITALTLASCTLSPSQGTRLLFQLAGLLKLVSGSHCLVTAKHCLPGKNIKYVKKRAKISETWPGQVTISTQWLAPRDTVTFVSPRPSMFLVAKPRRNIKCFVIPPKWKKKKVRKLRQKYLLHAGWHKFAAVPSCTTWSRISRKFKLLSP